MAARKDSISMPKPQGGNKGGSQKKAEPMNKKKVTPLVTGKGSTNYGTLGRGQGKVSYGTIGRGVKATPKSKLMGSR